MTTIVPYAVNVGGDRYFLGEKQPVDMAFKGEAEFENAFGSGEKISSLILKHFPFGRNYKKIKYANEKDLDEVKEIITTRIEKLNLSRVFNNGTLSSIPTEAYYTETTKILDFLNNYSFGEDETIKQKKELAGSSEVGAFTEEEQFKLILEMAWYLLHPDRLHDTEVRRSWLDAVVGIKGMTLGNMIEMSQLEASNSKEIKEIIKNKKHLDLLRYLNVGAFAKKSNSLENAWKDSKNSIIGSEQNIRLRKLLEERIKSLLVILESHKYFTNSGGVMNIVSNMNQGPFNAMTKTLDKSLVSKLDMSLDPIFVYMKNVYGAGYELIEGFVNSYNESIPLKDLLTLVQYYNVVQEAGGMKIVRLDDIDVSIYNFIKSYSMYMKAKYDDMSKNQATTPKDFMKKIDALAITSNAYVEFYLPEQLHKASSGNGQIEQFFSFTGQQKSIVVIKRSKSDIDKEVLYTPTAYSLSKKEYISIPIPEPKSQLKLVDIVTNMNELIGISGPMLAITSLLMFRKMLGDTAGGSGGERDKKK